MLVCLNPGWRLQPLSQKPCLGVEEAVSKNEMRGVDPCQVGIVLCVDEVLMVCACSLYTMIWVFVVPNLV